MKPSEVLRQAADLLSEPGRWAQGGDGLPCAILWPPFGSGERLCAFTAIYFVTNDDENGSWARQYLRKVIDHGSIVEWNDMAGRTVETVVQALKNAADAADRDGR
jgi:hypothetical protein